MDSQNDQELKKTCVFLTYLSKMLCVSKRLMNPVWSFIGTTPSNERHKGWTFPLAFPQGLIRSRFETGMTSKETTWNTTRSASLIIVDTTSPHEPSLTRYRSSSNTTQVRHLHRLSHYSSPSSVRLQRIILSAHWAAKGDAANGAVRGFSASALVCSLKVFNLSAPAWNWVEPSHFHLFLPPSQSMQTDSATSSPQFAPQSSLRRRDWLKTPGRFQGSRCIWRSNWVRAVLERSGWVRACKKKKKKL